MNKIKKINLLFCLIFSFIFFFGNVFSVQAGGVVQDSKVMKQCIDQNEYPNEIVECVINYTMQDIRNHGEKKIIWSVDDVKCRIAKHPCYMWDSLYRFNLKDVKICEKKNSALIYVTVYRISGICCQEKEFDLTFELKLN